MTMRGFLKVGFFLGLAGAGIWLRRKAIVAAHHAIEQEKHDQALDDTFPASDPVCP